MPEGFFGPAHLANLGVAALLSYLVGGIPFGLITGWVVAGKDVRTFGSGNIGATNVGRMLGFKWFLVVFALDFLKGLAPVLFATIAQRSSLGSVSTYYLTETAALAAVLGHVFPIYLKFKGGKGVATSIGVLVALEWLPALIGLVCFLVLFLATRFVAVGSIGFALAFAGTYFATVQNPWQLELRARTVLAIVVPVLIIYAHRSNIVRLRQGSEAKIGRTKRPESDVTA